MELCTALKHPIETARSAPLGTFLCGSNTLFGGWYTYSALETNVDRSMYCTMIALSGIAAALGGKLMKRQLDLKQRLEKSIDAHGFEERIFNTTTDEWCNRQTARVVCENNGMLEQYESLCEENIETAELKWIPHV